MKKLFNEIDNDHSGLITLDEFENFIGHERVIAYLESMKLDISGRPAPLLFELCKFIGSEGSDSPGDAISVEEFCSAIRQLGKDVMSLDSALLQRELSQLRHDDLPRHHQSMRRSLRGSTVE